jgi:hypothetical protein
MGVGGRERSVKQQLDLLRRAFVQVSEGDFATFAT